MGLVRIALVSDDRLFLEGVAQILSRDGLFTVSVSDSLTDLNRVVDIRVIDAGSNEAVAPDTREDRGAPPFVVVVNAPDDAVWAADALGKGVRGILTRASGADDLVSAIHVVHQGGIWARRRWLTAYVQRATQRPDRAADLKAPPALDARLSKREREVFRHAATGLCNKELAQRLSISEATVKAHLTRIFQKVGVSGRAELAAAYHGLRVADNLTVVRRSA
jgi:DNA-binding NarL/FixJ family response regulator